VVFDSIAAVVRPGVKEPGHDLATLSVISTKSRLRRRTTKTTVLAPLGRVCRPTRPVEHTPGGCESEGAEVEIAAPRLGGVASGEQSVRGGESEDELSRPVKPAPDGVADPATEWERDDDEHHQLRGNDAKSDGQGAVREAPGTNGPASGIRKVRFPPQPSVVPVFHPPSGERARIGDSGQRKEISDRQAPPTHVRARPRTPSV
jgi:hypothetical protein